MNRVRVRRSYHWSRLGIPVVGVLLALGLMCWQPQAYTSTVGGALVLEVKGPIIPSISEYVLRGIDHARDHNAQLVVLRMDTPGGLDTSMRDIIQGILNSSVPVVGYVSPAGARAASAGTYILYAGHIAAMSEATNLGAATPVSMAQQVQVQVGVQQDADGAGSEDGENGEDVEDVAGNQEAMRRKITNDASAYIRSLAELRGRNAEWAERAVREGASLSAHEALAMNVIDIVAEDLPGLLEELHGWRVDVQGRDVVFDTNGITVENFSQNWRDRLLAVLSDPNIAVLLLNLGLLAIALELYSPGLVIPGVLGVVAVLFGLYSLHILPVNFAGVTLMLLGIALMVLELFIPTMGLLVLAGLVSLVMGGVLLFEPQQFTSPEDWSLAVSPYLLALVAAVCVATVMVLMPMLIRALRRPVVSGTATMIGGHGVVLADFAGARGRIRIQGEDWDAEAGGSALKRGADVRVTRVQGLLLSVEPERQGASDMPAEEK